MTKRAITTAALVAGLFVHTQGFTQVPINPGTSASTAADAATMSEPEKAARKTWRAVMKNTPMPGKGCFHVSYPNVAWESVECKVTQPRIHHAPRRPTVGAPGSVGDGNDYMAQAHGLIYEADGKFFISDVTSETNVPSSSGGGILGPNEYMLQINTNNGGSPDTGTARAVTNACNGHPHCSVWQQFMYATDYNPNEPGKAQLFIQYWLLGWYVPGDVNQEGCPKPWNTSPNDNGDIDCYINSPATTVPNIPVTDLGDVILSGSVTNGGHDYLSIEYGDNSWGLAAEDNVLDIASVWTQAEFNVVGDTDRSQADFNIGAQIIVVLAILDGSNSAPTCVANIAPTGETNNLTLGACQTGVGNVIDWGGCGNQGSGCVGVDIYGPYVEFTETQIPLIRQPPVCFVCKAQDAPQGEARADGTAASLK